jgi:hypothetical protein
MAAEARPAMVADDRCRPCGSRERRWFVLQTSCMATPRKDTPMARYKRFLSRGALFGVTAAMLAGCASPQAHVREIDPEADPILKKMCDALDNAKAFRFRVRATMDRPVETGQLAQFHRTSDIVVMRPDRMCSVTDSDDGKWSAWYRGKTLTVLDRESNMYATEAVPGRIGPMLDYLVDKYDLVIPAADLLIGETYASLLADVDSGEYVGLHNVGDVSCHHLLFRQENLDWQIWIDAGEPPLPRKLVITYIVEPEQPQYVATMDDWNLAPTLPDSTFVFTPPKDAKNVPMADLVASKQGEQP